MKVKDLKKALVGLDPEANIIIATDEEGNGYGDIDNVIGKHTYETGVESVPVYALYPITFINPDDVY